MKRIPWHETEPGHFEVDLVHHCGPSADGASRLQRRYDAAQPPPDRLLASHALPGRRQEQLLFLRDQINPRLLRQMIYDLLDHLFTLPGVEPGQL